MFCWSVHCHLSVDNELCSFIPMLLNMYDFIFIPITIFDMHESFFRGNAQKQHLLGQSIALRCSAPQCRACYHPKLREMLLCHSFPKEAGEEVEEDNSVCKELHISPGLYWCSHAKGGICVGPLYLTTDASSYVVFTHFICSKRDIPLHRLTSKSVIFCSR